MKFGAIDAGGKKFICGITDEHGNTLEKVSFLTETPEKTIPLVIDFFKRKNIVALGIGCFGPLDLNFDSKTYGYITSSPKKAWRNYNILGTLHSELNIPVYLDTNINAAVLGESVWGAAKGLNNSIFLTIGSGIGGGAIVEGKLIHGMIHPEMGHIFVSRHPRDKFAGNCPFHGGNCLEGMASGPAIEKRWNKPLTSLPEDHPAWDLEAFYIAHALVNYILVLSPERIILGGDVMKFKHLLPTVRKSVVKLLNGYVQTEQIFKNINDYIVFPDLGENSGFFGAVALCIKNFK
ncbi:Putative fructokinase [Fusobacterium necrogenes]|uniref:fructokinase n=1 Tax=Fusobacterium necrogenes TaxID=858 RepID=A0A377GZC1_9FUSO|nr:ROK family protein [Fusobacterium necrogenes]STO32339.1 Putative fructokinase [Fusobacterium necrogenes]